MTDSNDPKNSKDDPSTKDAAKDVVREDNSDEAGATVNIEEMKSSAQDAAEKMVDELQAAFKRGGEDAKDSFEGATDQFKEIIEKGAYSMGFGGAFASQFVSTVLEDVMPDTVRKGATEGAERGRNAGEQFKSKVSDTTDAWKDKAKDAEPSPSSPSGGDTPEGSPA